MAYLDPSISKLKPRTVPVTKNPTNLKQSPTLSTLKSLSSNVTITKPIPTYYTYLDNHSASYKKRSGEKLITEKPDGNLGIKEVGFPEKGSLPQKSLPIPVILTSPDGKVKHLFKKNKPRIVFGEGISHTSGFWLPKVDRIKESCNELKNEVGQQNEPCKTDDKDLKQFEEALKHSGLHLDSSNLNVCQTVDGDWIAINKEIVVRLKYETYSVQCISIKDISSIFVEANYMALCLLLDPEKTDIEYLDIIPGQLSKTESLISSLLFASSRLLPNSQTNHRLDLINVPMLELPSWKLIFQHIYGLTPLYQNLYSGLSIVESLELETNIDDDLMMQIGSDKYQPVNIRIRGCSFRIVPTTGSNNTHDDIKDEIEVNMSEIYSIAKSDTPRPHTLIISWDAKSINISASTSSIAFELFSRLRAFKDCNSVIERQPAHVVLSDFFFFLFSARKSKDLLLQTPTLNLITLGNPDPMSILLASTTKEADESLGNMKNTCWWKLTFFIESECQKFSETFSKFVETQVEDGY